MLDTYNFGSVYTIFQLNSYHLSAPIFPNKFNVYYKEID